MSEPKIRPVSKNELLNELLTKQRKNITQDKKLQYSELKRICKYISLTLFDQDKCSLWSGYVTNSNNINKGIYINFYFRNKKIALHRLLYINYVGDLCDDEYLKFTCDNKGRCCCVHHLQKYKCHPQNNIDEPNEDEFVHNQIKMNDIHKIKNVYDDNSFKLSFE